MKDIALDSALDLQITDGDFRLIESTEQHQKLLLLAGKGHIRTFGDMGVGLVEFVNEDNLGGLYDRIQRDFEKDGMSIDDIRIQSDGNIQIDAAYE